MSPAKSLIALLQDSNLAAHVPGNGSGVNAQLINEVSRAAGCDGGFAKDTEYPGDSGSNLFVALLYQNLILSERVLALEESINKEGL